MTATSILPDVARHRTAGVFAGIASALAFASSGVVMKPLLGAGWSLGAALVMRMGIAALLLSPWVVRALLRDPGMLRRSWLLIVGFGLTGVTGCQVLFFAAIQRMPVAIALLVQYLAPVILVVWVWARTRRRPSVPVLAGTGLAIIGLVMVLDLTGATFDPIGVACAVGAAVCLAAYFLIAERSSASVPPLAMAGGGLVVGAVILGALCAVGVLPFAAPGVSTELAGISVPWMVSVAWVALVSTALAYGLGIIAVPRVGVRLASFIALLEVLFAMLFAWLLLGETPTAVQGVGSVLVLAGVMLVRSDGGGVASAEPVQRSRRASSMRGARR